MATRAARLPVDSDAALVTTAIAAPPREPAATLRGVPPGPPPPPDTAEVATAPAPRRGSLGHPPVPSDPAQLAAALMRMAPRLPTSPLVDLESLENTDVIASSPPPPRARPATIEPVAVLTGSTVPRSPTHAPTTTPTRAPTTTPTRAPTTTPTRAATHAPKSTPTDAPVRRAASSQPIPAGLALRAVVRPATSSPAPHATSKIPAANLDPLDTSTLPRARRASTIEGDRRARELPSQRSAASEPPWPRGLADRVDASLERETWGTETPVVAPPPGALRVLLGVPDPTRQQPIPERELLQRQAAQLGDRRPPHPTAEVDPDDIEVAIEVAPPARRPHAHLVGAKSKKSE
jgi:hypothetical protein